MIDRVNLRAYPPSPDAVLDRLATPTRETLPDGQVRWKGQHGPFAYTLSGGTLRLRGCLAAYAAGAPPSLVARVAAERLSDALGFDVGTAEVTRVEVFADLALRRPVCLYLPLLWTLARHKRLAVQDPRGAGETVKFITHRRSLQFYDKGAQTGRQATGGWMRIELSYRSGGVAERFGKLALARVASEPFRVGAAQEWRGWYGKVEKGRELRADRGARAFVRALAAEAIYGRGVGDVLAEVAAHRAAGAISKSTAHDRRRDVLRLAQDPAFTDPSPLLAELDDAVAQAAARMVR